MPDYFDVVYDRAFVLVSRCAVCVKASRVLTRCTGWYELGSPGVRASASKHGRCFPGAGTLCAVAVVDHVGEGLSIHSERAL